MNDNFREVLKEKLFLDELSNTLFLLDSPLRGYSFVNDDVKYIAIATYDYFKRLEEKSDIKIISKTRNPYYNEYKEGISGYSFDEFIKEFKNINFNINDYIKEINLYKQNISSDFPFDFIWISYITLSLISMYYEKYLLFSRYF